MSHSTHNPVNPADPPEPDAQDGPGKAPTWTRFSRISLKQWRLFHAVIDHDGFAEAADRLHISQSSISHALAKLQDQLGVPLLVIKGRKAHITHEGKVLIGRSRDLVRLAVELEVIGENLRRGWDPEIRVAAEPNFPAELLIQASNNLHSAPGKIRLCVEEVKLSELKRLLHDDTIDLAISTELVPGFSGHKLIEIEHLAIARPGNPLFKMNRELTFDDLETQFRIALNGSGDDTGTATSNHPWHSPARWKMSSLDSAVEALRHDDGYAWLPRSRVQAWLDVGIVKSLPLRCGSTYRTSMYLMRGRSLHAGATTFADALHVATRHPHECC
jgi:DNA-binding transcriptional LysR family regulator